MNKRELVSAIAEKSGLSKKDSEAVLIAMTDVVTAALQIGHKVKLAGFGSFEVKERSARTAVNPRTKELVELPASKVPVFKAGKALKDAVK